MKELKVCVEKAVRPVRAMNRRKDAMREELYGHLTKIFEQELANLGEQQAAVEAAIRRFGEPAELTRELQQTVPWPETFICCPIGPLKFLDRLSVVPEVLRKKDESADRYSVRMMSRFFGVFFVAVGLPLAWLMYIADPRIGLTIGLIHALPAILAWITFLFPGLGVAVHDVFYQCRSGSRPSLRRIIRSARSSLVLLGIGLVLLLILERYHLYQQVHLYILMGLPLLCPWVLGIGSWLAARDIRRYDQWGRLDIVEAPA